MRRDSEHPISLNRQRPSAEVHMATWLQRGSHDGAPATFPSTCPHWPYRRQNLTPPRYLCNISFTLSLPVASIQLKSLLPLPFPFHLLLTDIDLTSRGPFSRSSQKSIKFSRLIFEDNRALSLFLAPPHSFLPFLPFFPSGQYIIPVELRVFKGRRE
jgi:hypothetical protein